MLPGQARSGIMVSQGLFRGPRRVAHTRVLPAIIAAALALTACTAPDSNPVPGAPPAVTDSATADQNGGSSPDTAATVDDISDLDLSDVNADLFDDTKRGEEVRCGRGRTGGAADHQHAVHRGS